MDPNGGIDQKTGETAGFLLRENDDVVFHAWSAVSAAIFCFKFPFNRVRFSLGS